MCVCMHLVQFIICAAQFPLIRRTCVLGSHVSLPPPDRQAHARCSPSLSHRKQFLIADVRKSLIGLLLRHAFSSRFLSRRSGESAAFHWSLRSLRSIGICQITVARMQSTPYWFRTGFCQFLGMHRWREMFALLYTGPATTRHTTGLEQLPSAGVATNWIIFL